MLYITCWLNHGPFDKKLLHIQACQTFKTASATICHGNDLTVLIAGVAYLMSTFIA